jgi:hypothetical protein
LRIGGESTLIVPVAFAACLLTVAMGDSYLLPHRSVAREAGKAAGPGKSGDSVASASLIVDVSEQNRFFRWDSVIGLPLSQVVRQILEVTRGTAQICKSGY